MAHSYWITKDLIPLKTLLNIRLYTCGVLINLRWVCVCVCRVSFSGVAGVYSSRPLLEFVCQ